MIRERLLAVREKRAALIAQAGRQRAELHALVRRTDAAAVWVERARALLERAWAHPVWLAAALALLVALRPRKTLRWAATGFSLWRSWRGLKAWAERLSASAQRGAY